MPLLIFLISFNLFGQNPSAYPFILKQVLQKNEIQKIRVADLNGDGYDEYLILVPQQGAATALRVYGNDLHRIYFQKNFNSEILDFMSCPSGICRLMWKFVTRNFTILIKMVFRKYFCRFLPAWALKSGRFGPLISKTGISSGNMTWRLHCARLAS